VAQEHRLPKPGLVDGGRASAAPRHRRDPPGQHIEEEATDVPAASGLLELAFMRRFSP